ncbi:MAG: hypothetical protein U0S12_03430 [Fimbriimonadales bacterium]
MPRLTSSALRTKSGLISDSANGNALSFTTPSVAAAFSLFPKSSSSISSSWAMKLTSTPATWRAASPNVSESG